mmetsp:Transcript_28615/g.95064  ORF Transcript_28615/g.95064 Transcript_28615/m.95064 type:complete len:210 (-) Transcript_28615:11-640(-)
MATVSRSSSLRAFLASRTAGSGASVGGASVAACSSISKATTHPHTPNWSVTGSEEAEKIRPLQTWHAEKAEYQTSARSSCRHSPCSFSNAAASDSASRSARGVPQAQRPRGKGCEASRGRTHGLRRFASAQTPPGGGGEALRGGLAASSSAPGGERRKRRRSHSMWQASFAIWFRLDAALKRAASHTLGGGGLSARTLSFGGDDTLSMD